MTAANAFLPCLLVMGVVVVSRCLALTAAPFFEFNYDLPPEQRWVGAVDAVLAVHPYDASFGPFFQTYGAFLAKQPAGTADTLEGVVRRRFPTNYRELFGIRNAFAAAGHPEVNVTTLAGFMFLYELFHVPVIAGAEAPLRRACTGILSLPADRSQPLLHGRNMDEIPHAGRNMTLLINFTRGGETQFQVFDWIWPGTGFTTSSRLGGVTLEENYRSNGPLGYGMVMARLTDGVTVPTHLLHRIIQEARMDFDQTLRFLTTSQFASPLYTIVGGTARRGAVVTIAWNKTDNLVTLLNDSSPVPYLVQTNYDRSQPDPPWDQRRTAAEAAMQQAGPEISGTAMGVWAAASVWPVHNPDTMYTAVMSPELAIVGFIRDMMEPDGYNPYAYTPL